MFRSWRKQLGFLLVMAMTFVSVVPVVQAASAPNIVTYQGRVLNANGVPVSDASLSMSFALYTAVTGGTCVWSNSSASCATTTTRTVTLTTGLFTENLGDTGNSYAAISDAIFGDNAALYLEVIIAGETLTPRRMITAAPYALNADTLDGIDSATLQLFETGSSRTFEDDAPVIIGTNAALTYGSGGVGDLRVEDELEVMGDGYIDNDLVVGASTSSTETITNVAFTLGGDDLFAAGDVGVEGSLYIDGGLDIIGTATFNADVDLTFATTENLTVTNSTATADVIDVTATAAGSDALEINFTLGNDTDVDTVNALEVLVTSVATGDADILRGISVGDLASAQAGVTETALLLGSGWDSNLVIADTTAVIGISDTGNLIINDGTNTLFTLTDNSNAGDLIVSGDFTAQGDNIDSAGAPLVLNATAGDEVRVGTGTPGVATGAGDFYVTDALEVDGALDVAGTATVGDISCVDCLDFTEFADSMTLDVATSITGAAGNILALSRTLTNATAENAMTVTVTASDTTGSTAAQLGLSLVNAASSEAVDVLLALSNDDADDTVGAAMALGAGGAGTDFTYGIDLDAGSIGTADIRFENSGTLDEGTAGTWTFDRSSSGTVTLAATDDDTNAALTVSSGGTGILTIDPTGAGSVVVGSVDVTSVQFTSNNDANNDFAFVGGVSMGDDVVITAGAGEIFTVTRTLTNNTAEHGEYIDVTASDTGSATAGQFGLTVNNAASTEALDAAFVAVNSDADDSVGAAFALDSGGAGTDFIFGLDLDAGSIGTADIRFENSGTLDESSAGTWTFDRASTGIVTLIGTDDDANAAFTISSGGTGVLSLDPTGAGSIVVGSADVTSVSFTTNNDENADFSFTGGATFNDNVIIDAGAAEVFSIVRTLTNATAENAVSISVTASDTTSSTTVQQGLLIDNAASSEALDAMIAFNNTDDDDAVGAGLLFTSGGTGTDFTYGIDLDAANIGTADIRFESSGTLAEAAAGNWTFDRSSSGSVVLLGTDDDTNTDLVISSSGTGVLTLDPSGAGSVVVGSADVTSIQFTTDNNAATDLSFTGGSSFSADLLTTTNAMTVSADALTTGFGLQVERADGATDFDGANPGALVYINQANDNTTSDGEALMVRNLGGGTSVGFYLIQGGLNAPPANSVSQTAMVIDVNEAAGDDVGTDEDVFIIRSDADGTPDTEFKVQLDGDISYDGTATSPASDLAEVYPSNEALIAGDLVVLDVDAPGKVKKSSAPYQANVFGAISTKPAVRMGGEIVGYDVALIGRIPLKVSAENGAIAVGDPLTSSSTSGYAMKATELGMIVGRALEAHAAGLGVISAFVDVQWYAGTILTTDGTSTIATDNVVVASLGTATAQAPTFGSYGLALRGSAWNGSEAETVEMMLQNVVDDEDSYRLSIRNTTETEVAYITNEGTMKIAGDMVIGGRLYPSDRGTPQTEKYIYYDGSAGPGGDFMRTNAKGWSTGSYDFAEMFPSGETLTSGDVVVFTGTGESVQRATGADNEQLAGIVSTRPGFLAGENVAGAYPIALAGRVPTKVGIENDAIAVGDPLAASTTAGVAMKATDAGQIIGYALESYTGSESDNLILAYVNVGYWSGGPQTITIMQNVASETPQNIQAYSALNMSGSIYMATNSILSIGRLEGVSGIWSIESDGTIRTKGSLKTVTQSYQGTDVETVAVTSPESVITLTGTSTLVEGRAEVRFEDVLPEYNDVISAIAPIRVIVTPSGPVSLYVSEKDQNHFIVERFVGSADVEFDWMVTGYRKGFEPEEEVDEVEEVEEVDEVAPGFSLGESVGESSDPLVPSVPSDLSALPDQEAPASPESPDTTPVDSAIEDDGGPSAEPSDVVIETPST